MFQKQMPIWAAAAALVFAGYSNAAPVEKSPKPVVEKPIFVGEVTANDVYVRSGPSRNHYPVIKLSAGTHITVYSVENGWCKIAPPTGAFSVMHKNFIDRGATDNEGVVNGSAVWVRAGSKLSSELSSRQLKLNRGARVTILGPHNQDFVRIVPPPGARLYISEQFVARAKGSPSASTPVAPAAFTGTDKTPAKHAAGQESSTPAALPPASAAVREELGQADAALDAEMEKPITHRDYAHLIAMFKPLVDQDVDAYARAYAKTRIAQLERATETQTSLRELRDLRDEISKDRNDATRQRSAIKPPPRPIGGGFDATGMLRISMAYNSAAGPRRYRLMSTDTDRPRTIGYVEIPRGADLDIDRYLGRKVGVRGEKTLQTGDVDPMIVYVAQELVVLDTSDTTNE
jgi:DNA-binding transcriptional regulator YdaS (Cro superfamily)